jgi:hypothetical protein
MHSRIQYDLYESTRKPIAKANQPHKHPKAYKREKWDYREELEENEEEIEN